MAKVGKCPVCGRKPRMITALKGTSATGFKHVIEISCSGRLGFIHSPVASQADTYATASAEWETIVRDVKASKPVENNAITQSGNKAIHKEQS